jgi:hypothetical protein
LAIGGAIATGIIAAAGIGYAARATRRGGARRLGRLSGRSVVAARHRDAQGGACRRKTEIAPESPRG